MNVWTRERVPSSYERCCCYQIFNSLKLFTSQPIVIKLRTQIGDNILHNRTVSDFNF